MTTRCGSLGDYLAAIGATITILTVTDVEAIVDLLPAVARHRR